MFSVLVNCDEQRMIFAVPRRVRFACLGLAGLGLLAIVVAIVFAATGRDPLPAEILMAAAGCLVVGSLLGLWLDEFDVNRAVRTYVRRRGLLPFIRRWDGTYGDFDHLLLRPARHKKTIAWCVFLIWKDPSREKTPLVDQRGRSSYVGEEGRQAALESMLDMAGKLDLPAFDETGKQVDEGAHEAAQMDAQPPEVTVDPLALWPAPTRSLLRVMFTVAQVMFGLMAIAGAILFCVSFWIMRLKPNVPKRAILIAMAVSLVFAGMGIFCHYWLRRVSRGFSDPDA